MLKELFKLNKKNSKKKTFFFFLKKSETNMKEIIQSKFKIQLHLILQQL